MQMPVPWHDNDPAEIGEKIRQQRKKQKLSQDQLADRMGTDRNAVHRHEKGQHEMNVCTLLRYADALEADPQSLLPDRYNTGPSAERTREAGRILEQLSEDSYRKIMEMANKLLEIESKMQQI